MPQPDSTGDVAKDRDRDDRVAEVRAQIEAGIADSKAGRTTPVEEVRARYGLEP